MKALLDQLNDNEVFLRPIKSWAVKNQFKGTVLINFISLDGLKIVAQYYLNLLKLQV